MIREENSRKTEMLKQLDDILPQSPNRPKTHGIFFYGIRSANLQEKDSPSLRNEGRKLSKSVIQYFVFLMTVKLYRKTIAS
uniref:Methionine aminopeptidase n=1 Tax=Glossina morsitans morsitans TaxID=37546 RepID=A0A1B0FES2_GLOMM